MNQLPYEWDRKSYQQFLKHLLSLADQKYQTFHQSLLNDNISVIGIPTPILKKIAKEISHTNYQSWLDQNNHHYYEEIMIHGLLLGYLQEDFNEIIEQLNQLLPYIQNWALCDGMCVNLKQIKKKQEDGIVVIHSYLQNQNSWIRRVGFVLLLDHYINDTYIDEVLMTCQNRYDSEYYVKMAIAWLISICYIKYKDKTKRFLQNWHTDDWTYNKAIQKICESKRIDIDEKKQLKTQKRKSK